MECIIQVFPDELHLLNLQPFLSACGDLHEGVKVKNILIALIERLATFASSEAGQASTKELQLFHMFNDQVSKILAGRREMAGEDAVSLELALLSLALKCYPGNLAYADAVFQATADFLTTFTTTGLVYNSAVCKETVKLLHLPIDHYNDIGEVLKLEHYEAVLNKLDGRGRRTASAHLLTNVLNNGTRITSPEQAESLLSLVAALVRDEEGCAAEEQDPDDLAEEQGLVARLVPLVYNENPDQHYLVGGEGCAAEEQDPDDLAEEQGLVARLVPLLYNENPDQHYLVGGEGCAAEEQDPEDLAEEQGLVARLVPLLYNENPDQHYLILSAARKVFGEGGAKRMRFTLPPLIFAVFELAQRFKDREEEDEKWEAKVGKVFKFCHASISALQKETEQAELALRLFLYGALLIDRIPHNNSESLAYEFMTQAFSLYEEEMTDSRAQVGALWLVIGSLERVTCFGEENHEPLRTQAALAAAKLFKKPDQCRAVAGVARLFWSPKVKDGNPEGLRDGRRVHECLKKALKIAAQCMDPAAQIQLFIEVLNHNLYFYHQGCEDVTLTYINQLLSRIRETLPQLEPSPETEQLSRSFNNTITFLRARQVQTYRTKKKKKRKADCGISRK